MIRSILRLTLMFLLWGVSKHAYCQIKSWNHTLYTTKDGLPSNVIRNTVQDKDGFLWIATESGLCRFDGDEFVKILHDEKDTNSIPSDCVNWVEVTPTNEILVATLKGLFVMNPKTKRGYTIHHTIEKGQENFDDKFAYIHIQYSIRKIIVLSSTAVHYYEFDMKPYAMIPYPYANKDIATHTDFTHHLPMILGNGDVIFEDNKTQHFTLVDYTTKKMKGLKDVPTHPYYPLAFIESIGLFRMDSLSNVWFYKTNIDTLFCFIPKSKVIYSYPLVGNAKNVSWICNISFPNSSSMLCGYIARSAGLLYEIPYAHLLKNNHQPIIIKNHSGFSAALYTAYADKDNHWWIASMNGLYLLKNNFRRFETIELPVAYHCESEWQYVTDIQAIDTTNFLITTRAEHCFLYNTLHNTTDSYLDTIPIARAWDYYLNTIIPLANKRWLIRGARDLTFENKKLALGLTPRNEFEKLIKLYANYGYYKDIHQNEWISFRDKGLVKWDAVNSVIKIFSPLNTFTSDQFNSIVGDSKGNIYFANYFKEGIWKYNVNTNKFELLFDGPKSVAALNWVSNLTVGDDNHLYFTNLQGLVICNLVDKSITLIGMNDGLPSNIISGLFYHRGNLFISTKSGLAIMDTRNNFIKTLHQKDGIVEDVVTKAYYFDENTNTLFIGGKGCVYKINMEYFFVGKNEANNIIDQSKVNNRSIDLTAKHWIFNHDENNISFSVSSIDFLSGSNKNYYYRIILNGKPSDLINNNGKQFNFINLSPGKYAIEIKSKNASDVWSNQVATISFEILTPWYNRGWFYLLVLCSIATALYLIYMNRIRQLKKIELIRNKLSRDLHDDIGSTLSSINILSRTAQRNAKTNDHAKTILSLEKINDRSQRLLENMKDIIWNINPNNDSLEELLSRMREYATTLLEAKHIEYEINFPVNKTDTKMSLYVKSNLYLIFKEAVNNLSKYSGCSKANLDLIFTEKYIHLTIKDNGVGFNINNVVHRGGLQNMKHRAEEIKGELKIISTSGNGTIVDVSISRQ